MSETSYGGKARILHLCCLMALLFIMGLMPACNHSFEMQHNDKPGMATKIPQTVFPTATLAPLGREIIDCDRTFYIAKKNESLSSIAQRHGVTIHEIKEYNGMLDSVVHEGMKLTIPLCPRTSTPTPNIFSDEGSTLTPSMTGNE